MENTIYLSLIDIIVHLFLLGIYVTSWTKLNFDSVAARHLFSRKSAMKQVIIIV